MSQLFRFNTDVVTNVNVMSRSCHVHFDLKSILSTPDTQPKSENTATHVQFCADLSFPVRAEFDGGMDILEYSEVPYK
ncbi:hypothetical protein J6590_006760 [Homalodisca vitripennis]|nr:hypothetical protein J6590_006760 [Homalodisca vitripennis]